MSEKYVHKLDKRTDYSYSIVLPKEIIDKLGWQNNQKIEIKLFGDDKILIQDWDKENKK